MIIYISLDPEAFERQNVPTIDRLLHEIVDIYLKGKHLIVMERETIEKIRSTVSLNRPTEVVLNDLYSFYSQTKNLAKNSPVLLEIRNIEGDLSKNDFVFSIGVNKFIEYDLSREAKLLVENKLNDGDFFAAALKRLAIKNRLGRLAFEVGHGGGDDMPAIFQDEIRARRITVCVADSDKKYPGAPISDKCRKLNKVLRNTAGAIADYVELPCHEAENMIPLSAFFELQLSDEHKATLTRLQSIEKRESVDAVPIQERLKLYFDFKDGVSPEKIDGMRNTNHKRFIREKFELVGFDVTKEAVAGLGDNLTRRLSQEGKAMAEFAHRMFSCPYWKDLFSSIFSNLLYFLLGAQKRAAL